jgi:hypothetical protein
MINDLLLRFNKEEDSCVYRNNKEKKKSIFQRGGAKQFFFI